MVISSDWEVREHVEKMEEWIDLVEHENTWDAELYPQERKERRERTEKEWNKSMIEKRINEWSGLDYSCMGKGWIMEWAEGKGGGGEDTKGKELVKTVPKSQEWRDSKSKTVTTFSLVKKNSD